jgi:cell division protein FtsZ
MPPALDPRLDFADPPRSFAVVGLGGAGGEAVRDLVEFGIPSVRAFAVNTDFRHLRQLSLDERILLGERTLQGRGAGGNRAAVLEAAEEGREELLRRLRPFEVVFLIAGLGGGTGSALLPYLANLLKQTDALPVPIVFLPFHLEIQTDSDRRENVRATLAELESVGGLLLALSNEKLRRFDRLPIARVFHVRNAYVHHLVTSLVDMVEQPSQINVDLASLKTHLGDAGVSTLVSSEFHVSEPERLVDQALTESLLDFNLGDSPTALVHIDGGSNLTLHTMDRIVQAMRRRLGEPRRLMLGTRTHPERRDIVRLTAVVGGLRPGTLQDASGV